ncbi:TPA: hypothetical protein QCJ76_001825 [Enterobacter asburiae]|nr:hypothetical protein [Enterobacter asburiae]HDR2860299.1 hypothetical protein [Enterobacter asburiae]HDR2865098.1 hypothetical protein [Enterobacter asburiae]
MTRIGILGINDLTETFLVELFRLDPYAHVFLSAGDMEPANLLARKFPCWIQDDVQAVINEVDTVIITTGTSSAENPQERLEYRKSQLVFFLETWPSINSQVISPQTDININFITGHLALANIPPFIHLTEVQIDDYLFILKVLLVAMNSMHTLDDNFRSSSQ